MALLVPRVSRLGECTQGRVGSPSSLGDAAPLLNSFLAIALLLPVALQHVTATVPELLRRPQPVAQPPWLRPVVRPISLPQHWPPPVGKSSLAGRLRLGPSGQPVPAKPFCLLVTREGQWWVFLNFLMRLLLLALPVRPYVGTPGPGAKQSRRVSLLLPLPTALLLLLLT